MQRAYLGESFEQSFRISDPRDPEREIDSATYRIIKIDDGTIADAGIMSVEGREVKFRFNAVYPGVMRIEVTWQMGQDKYMQPFLMSVE